MNKGNILNFVKEIIASSKNEDVEVIRGRIKELSEWMERIKVLDKNTKELLQKIEMAIPEIMLITGGEISVEDSDSQLERFLPKGKIVSEEKREPKQKVLERHYHHYHDNSSSRYVSSPRYVSSSSCSSGGGYSSSHC